MNAIETKVEIEEKIKASRHTASVFANNVDGHQINFFMQNGDIEIHLNITDDENAKFKVNSITNVLNGSVDLDEFADYCAKVK